ncbi:hypothetical protein [Comamonas serinivorans]|uniref:hypothetical protein n=1 Tax=Comamonas serinivorans TaxID=1082851 RepID=UPI0012FC3472|nr:hypothetical protein [Comamonas serinivorans]
MNPALRVARRTWLPVATSLALALTACGGGGDDDTAPPPSPRPTVTITPTAGAGAYRVAVDRGERVQVGTYLQASDGQGLVVLVGEDDKAQAVYRHSAGNTAGWLAAGHSPTAPITFANQTAWTPEATSLSQLAGVYRTLLANQDEAVLRLDASGTLSATGGDCQLSGRLSASTLPQAFEAEIRTQGCSGLPSQFTGVALIDADYAPAQLRLINTDANAVLELWLQGE